jgi:hypothetical protein
MGFLAGWVALLIFGGVVKVRGNQALGEWARGEKGDDDVRVLSDELDRFFAHGVLIQGEELLNLGRVRWADLFVRRGILNAPPGCEARVSHLIDLFDDPHRQRLRVFQGEVRDRKLIWEVERRLGRDPADRGPYYSLGEYFRFREEIRRAEGVGDAARVWRLKGDLSLLQGRYRLAVDRWVRSLRLKPDPSLAALVEGLEGFY